MYNILDKLKDMFFREEETQEFSGDYIQIELTQSAKESNVNDDFNKQIVIYRRGKRTNKIIDYSYEDLVAIKTVHPDMPVYEEKLAEDYEMVEEDYFGEVYAR